MTELLLIKAVHYLGFLGCLSASGAKNYLLRRPEVSGAALKTLIALDKVSGLSSVIILATGVAMAGWFAKPTSVYLGNSLFYLKFGLFVLASLAVLTTKPMLKQAQQHGTLHPTPWVRWRLSFDFLAILSIAFIGRLAAQV